MKTKRTSYWIFALELKFGHTKEGKGKRERGRRGEERETHEACCISFNIAVMPYQQSFTS